MEKNLRIEIGKIAEDMAHASSMINWKVVTGYGKPPHTSDEEVISDINSFLMVLRLQIESLENLLLTPPLSPF